MATSLSRTDHPRSASGPPGEATCNPAHWREARRSRSPRVPVGLPPVVLPVTFTVSALLSLSATTAFCGLEIVVDVAGVTVKHSSILPSLDVS